ncbi:sensor histidine kinase [Terrimonas pollutisoli]|uniref:sensor histidine kinase n=1 Tax=Terrimonas pollutisoli TaxID=3034147 RepID=UPI0023ED36DF|nr:ATP-binding protein [Terrimonas sp. H1YJ31]
MSVPVNILNGKLNTLFPFYFIINDSLTIADAGKSLSKLFPDIIGKQLQDCFRLKRPASAVFEFDSIVKYADQIFIFESTDGRSILFRGQIITTENLRILLFVSSPWITDADDLMKYNLLLTDFALHDTTTDMIQIIKSKEIMMNDIRSLANNLEMQKRELIRAKELADTNAELEAFSYSVSHDLRAPLRAISGYTGILITDYAGQLDAGASRFLNNINLSVRYMNRLIDDLLNLARMGKKELEVKLTDMDNLVKSVISSLLSQSTEPAKARINISVLEQAPCDASLMFQVWHNLISNALKYSGQQPSPYIEISSSRKEEEIIYVVKDNGVGFDMQYADRLFGVFQRLHPANEFEGTGVGLALVERIVKKHGGHVGAESEPGKGATFYFSLPLSSAQTNKTAHTEESAKMTQ